MTHSNNKNITFRYIFSYIATSTQTLLL